MNNATCIAERRGHLRRAGVSPARVLGMGAAIACLATAVDAQSVVTIPGTPSCAVCRIVMDSLFTLGSATDSVRPTSFGSVQRDSRGRFYAITDDQRVVAVFDSRGTLIGTIGRRGPGPGEFPTQLWRVHIGANDSVYVGTERQVSIFDRDWKFVRQLRLPTTAFTVHPLSDGGFVAGMSIPAQTPRRPFHILNPDGSVSRSFGPEVPPRVGRGPPRPLRSVSGSTAFVLAPGKQSIWVDAPQYSLERWTLDGRLIERLIIDAPWFDRDREPVYDSVVTGTSTRYFARTNAPYAELAGVDPSGLFWYNGSIPVSGSVGTFEKPQARTRRLEILDIAARRIVASVEAKRPLKLIAGSDLAVASEANADDEITVSVWRVALRRP